MPSVVWYQRMASQAPRRKGSMGHNYQIYLMLAKYQYLLIEIWLNHTKRRRKNEAQIPKLCVYLTFIITSWKGRGTRDQIANIHWIMVKARECQKIIYFCFIDYNKAFDCVDNNKLWKILQEMGIPDHQTCLLRNLYAGQEARLEPEMNNRLVPNRERSTSRLYVVSLFI